MAGNRIPGTRYREALWWYFKELSEHMRSVPILVTAIKTHQTTLQTLQIITIVFRSSDHIIFPLKAICP